MKIVLALIGLVVVLVATLAIAAPSELHVVRSVDVNQKQEVIFDYVYDLTKFNEWSPWYERDPDATYTVSENGQEYRWKSDKEDVGEGAMRHTEINRPTSIIQDLEFIAPMEGLAEVKYTFEEDGESTRVSWGMRQATPFPGNIFVLLLGIEEQVGKDFEKGLEQLKMKVEAITLPVDTMQSDSMTADMTF